MNPILFTMIKILIMVGFLFNVAALLTWLDRRLGGAIQDRIGPNRAYLPIFGKKFRVAGLLHTAADGLKFFFKEDFMPPKADKVLFSIAPILVMVRRSLRRSPDLASFCRTLGVARGGSGGDVHGQNRADASHDRSA